MPEHMRGSASPDRMLRAAQMRAGGVKDSGGGGGGQGT